MTAGLAGDRIIAHNLIVGSGTIGAGLLGIAFQALFAHTLRPAEFGSVFAVVTIIGLIGLPASAFTLLMAREASRDRANGTHEISAAILGRGNRALVLGGAGLAVILTILSPAVASVINVPRGEIIAAALGLPFFLALPLLLGELQGEQRFLLFTGLAAGQAGLKLVGAVGLGLLLGPAGIIGGISLASAAGYVVGLLVLRPSASANAAPRWWSSSLRYLAVILPSTLALAVLLSADVLLVKHFFTSRAAGEYAAVAAIGRAVFWGASGVATVLFPKVTYSGARGQSALVIVGASLLLVFTGGVAGLVSLLLTSNYLLTAFAGAAYAEAAPLLPWYAFGMTLLGGAAVLIATHQTTGRPHFLAVVVPITAAELALLVVFHQSLGQVVAVVDICMALLVGGLAVLYVLQERSDRQPVRSGEAAAPTAHTMGKAQGTV